METQKVQRLRELHGIGDSRNEYSEEEIESLLKNKAHYFSFRVEEYGKVDFVEKEVVAYISKDDCVWMKDEELTGETCYMPCCRIRQSEGVYMHNNRYGYNVYFFFDKDYESSLEIVKNHLIDNINETVEYHKKIIDGLQTSLTNIQSNPRIISINM